MFKTECHRAHALGKQCCRLPKQRNTSDQKHINQLINVTNSFSHLTRSAYKTPNALKNFLAAVYRQKYKHSISDSTNTNNVTASKTRLFYKHDT